MPKTILLADDSVTIQKVVGITFANEDVELITADNGDEALIRAREVKPDVILADVSMPGLDGYELCAAIRQEEELAHIPVLLLTGAFKTFDEGRAKSVGVSAYIAKPFEAQALVDQVQQLLKQEPGKTPVEEAAMELPVLEPAPEAPAEFVEADPAPPSSEFSFGALDFDEGAAGPGETRVLTGPLPAARPEAGAEIPAILEDPGPQDLELTAELAPEPHAAPSEDALYGGSSFIEPEPSDEPPPALEGFELRPAGRLEEESLEPEGGTTAPLPAEELMDSDDSTQTETTTGTELPEVTEDFVIEHEPVRMMTSEVQTEVDEARADPLELVDPFAHELEAEPVILRPEHDGEIPTAASHQPAAVVAHPTVASESAESPEARPGAIDPTTLHRSLEKLAWEAFGSLSEQLVREVVAKVEAIAWEVIPQLAEQLIRDEIERIKADPPE